MGYDVILRHTASWSMVSTAASADGALTITPDFFSSHGMKGKSVDWNNAKLADMANTLIHEALHQHLLSRGLWLVFYTTEDISKEEALATVLGHSGAKAYLAEKISAERKNSLSEESKSRPLAEADFELRELSLKCRDFRGFYRKKFRKKLKNNALLLAYRLYYNEHTEKYLQYVAEGGNVRKIIRIFPEIRGK